MESILTTIKKTLGIEEEYTHFDVDLIIYINSVLAILTQIGVGPQEGFSIKSEDDIWTDFIMENIKLELIIKSYVHLKVKLLFDPPLSSTIIEAMNRMINEFEWRIQVETDQVKKNKEEIQNE